MRGQYNGVNGATCCYRIDYSYPPIKSNIKMQMKEVSKMSTNNNSDAEFVHVWEGGELRIKLSEMQSGGTYHAPSNIDLDIDELRRSLPFSFQLPAWLPSGFILREHIQIYPPISRQLERQHRRGFTLLAFDPKRDDVGSFHVDVGGFVMEGFTPLGPTRTQQVTIKGGEAVWGTRDTFRELAWVRDAHQYGIRCYALEIADEVIYHVANSFQ